MKHEEFDDIPISAITHVIDEYVHSERDRRIMKLHLCDGYSAFEITYRILKEEISLKTVKRVIAKHEPRIFRHLS